MTTITIGPDDHLIHDQHSETRLKIKIAIKRKVNFPIKITVEDTQNITPQTISVSKQSDISVKVNDFQLPDPFDTNKICEIYDKAKALYTHYITRLRCLRRVREIAAELMKQNHQTEIACNGLKITTYETIGSFTKDRLMEAIRIIFADNRERADFIELFTMRAKNTTCATVTDYPATLKIVDQSILDQLQIIPENNHQIDHLFALAQTAANAKEGACSYRNLMFSLRIILKSYTNNTPKTIKIMVNEKDAIYSRKTFKTTLSINLQALNHIINEFCQTHPYQTTELEHTFVNTLINIKAATPRKAIKTSEDFEFYEDS